MAKSTNERPHDKLVEELRSISARLPSVADVRDERAARGMRKQIDVIAHELHALVAKLDPVRRPASVFDPSSPAIVGRMIAMTLVAQERTPLGGLGAFYGSGVYAIYYGGAFSPYKRLSGTEHPIYVGKADPAVDQARDAVTQGKRLFGRLKEHARSIGRTGNLSPDDFTCRFLIVSSGWQKAAEDYLIHLFRPIWNTEIKIAFGIGKHGDAATTRGNGRSPWDTLHPGRRWAAPTVEDQKSSSRIVEEIESHLANYPPYRTTEDLFARFMEDMRQLPPEIVASPLSPGSGAS